MSCEFVVLPADSVASAAEVEDYVAASDGIPAVSLGPVLAGLWRWNTEIPVWNGRITLAAVGECVRVMVPEHAAWRALLWIEELIAGTEFALYDSRDGSLGTPEMRRMRVNLGGQRYFDVLTERQLHSWIPELAKLARTPFLIVQEPGDQDTFIQTLRQGADSYLLEYREGGHMFSTTLDNPARIADYMWDWADGRRENLDKLFWTKRP
ncbi:hypothetical protein [Nocardia acidivorans]|uniref:hypothetical protein n=1 Tax=Nocardia acidivorans TaxID=404580 RepID=UPI00082AC1C4|nr:hypothetical protein [Nocardia acidivorans]